MKKINVSSSGIFTIKEYLLDRGLDPLMMVKKLSAGPGEVREVISYVFEGEDPLGIDAKSFSSEEFEKIYPRMEEYGPGLAFDVIVNHDGNPVTVELTLGSEIAAINTLDKLAELEDLLGEPARSAAEEQTDGAAVLSDSQDAAPLSQGDASGGEAFDDGMDPESFLQILSVAERLKCTMRHCETSSGRKESVAEHSWRTALMAMLLSGKKEFASVNMDRVIRMCLIHDLGEAFTGDIPAFEKKESDAEEELRCLTAWISSFPEGSRREFEELFAEMEERRTPEARMFKALDKLEAVIQHNESDLSSWLPLEYDLQFTYGKEEVQFSPFLRELRDSIDAWTRKKIQK